MIGVVLSSDIPLSLITPLRVKLLESIKSIKTALAPDGTSILVNELAPVVMVWI